MSQAIKTIICEYLHNNYKDNILKGNKHGPEIIVILWDTDCDLHKATKLTFDSDGTILEYCDPEFFIKLELIIRNTRIRIKSTPSICVGCTGCLSYSTK